MIICRAKCQQIYTKFVQKQLCLIFQHHLRWRLQNSTIISHPAPLEWCIMIHEHGNVAPGNLEQLHFISFQHCYFYLNSHVYVYRYPTLNHFIFPLELVFYPMTKTQFMQKRGVGKCVISAWLRDVSYRSWDRNPCPAALCFPGPDDALCWKMCDFHTGMGSCYIPLIKVSQKSLVDQSFSSICRKCLWLLSL